MIKIIPFHYIDWGIKITKSIQCIRRNVAQNPKSHPFGGSIFFV